MKMLSHNSLVAVVLDNVSTQTESGIALVRKTSDWAIHAGKTRVATVIAAPETYTIYKGRVGKPDKVITTKCPVKSGDRVFLSRLAGCTKFEYLGKEIVLVRVGEIIGEVYDEKKTPPDLSDYIEQCRTFFETHPQTPPTSPCAAHAMEAEHDA